MSIAALTPHLVSPLPSGPLPGVPATPTLATAPDDDDDSFSFDDLLDAVNPLQHIPVIGTLYRAITGDTIKTAPKILGDTLYGGATGFVSSVADTIFEKVTGKSVGDTVLALVEDVFSPSAPDATPQTAIASAAPAPLALPAPDSLAAIPSNTSLAALTAPQAPVSVLPAEQDAIVIPGQEELLTALRRAGIGQDVALRAADAYRRTITVSSAAAGDALPNGFRASIAR